MSFMFFIPTFGGSAAKASVYLLLRLFRLELQTIVVCQGDAGSIEFFNDMMLVPPSMQTLHEHQRGLF